MALFILYNLLQIHAVDQVVPVGVAREVPLAAPPPHHPHPARDHHGQQDRHSHS